MPLKNLEERLDKLIDRLEHWASEHGKDIDEVPTVVSIQLHLIAKELKKHTTDISAEQLMLYRRVIDQVRLWMWEYHLRNPGTELLAIRKLLDFKRAALAKEAGEMWMWDGDKRVALPAPLPPVPDAQEEYDDGVSGIDLTVDGKHVMKTRIRHKVISKLASKWGVWATIAVALFTGLGWLLRQIMVWAGW